MSDCLELCDSYKLAVCCHDIQSPDHNLLPMKRIICADMNCFLTMFVYYSRVNVQNNLHIICNNNYLGQFSFVSPPYILYGDWPPRGAEHIAPL